MNEDWTGWVPFGIRWEASNPVIDWCDPGARRLTEPFFDQAISPSPQNAEPRRPYRVTSIEMLDHLQAIRPGLPPNGLILHMGRCGSTLIARMLAASPENIVISEANILDSILRAARRQPGMSQELAIRLLRGVVGALGQRRTGSEKHAVIKFTSRSILDLPLIHRAWPEAPWIFVYRDPLEVLVAHVGRAGAALPPGLAEAGLIDTDPAAARGMPPTEFWARVLASRCAAAWEFRDEGRSLLVNYAQLPQFVWESLPGLFRMSCAPDDVERMQATARFNAKDPSRIFTEDGEVKRQAATAEMRALVDQLVMPHYQRLEERRRATPEL
ncbi:MAG: sulfotransferase [Anaerolineae bacterium]